MPTSTKTTAGTKSRSANGKAPKRAAAAAVAELNGTDETGPRVEVFRGVELTIPNRLPQTFMMDYAELQEMQINQRPEAIGMACILCKSVIGPDQWRTVRNSLDGEMSEDGGATILGELLSHILNGMDMEPGESKASGTP